MLPQDVTTENAHGRVAPLYSEPKSLQGMRRLSQIVFLAFTLVVPPGFMHKLPLHPRVHVWRAAARSAASIPRWRRAGASARACPPRCSRASGAQSVLAGRLSAFAAGPMALAPSPPLVAPSRVPRSSRRPSRASAPASIAASSASTPTSGCSSTCASS